MPLKQQVRHVKMCKQHLYIFCSKSCFTTIILPLFIHSISKWSIYLFDIGDLLCPLVCRTASPLWRWPSSRAMTRWSPCCWRTIQRARCVCLPCTSPHARTTPRPRPCSCRTTTMPMWSPRWALGKFSSDPGPSVGWLMSDFCLNSNDFAFFYWFLSLAFFSFLLLEFVAVIYITFISGKKEKEVKWFWGNLITDWDTDLLSALVLTNTQDNECDNSHFLKFHVFI